MKKLLNKIPFLILGLPLISSARTQIVPEKCDDGSCGLKDLFNILDKVLEWSMIFTTTIATIMFVYAGFLYITSQGDSSQVSKATGIFKNVAIGFVIILTALFLVKEFLLKFGLEKLASLIS